MLLRLVDAPHTSSGRVAVECWRDAQWQPVAIDEEFALAFHAGEVSSAAADLSLNSGDSDAHTSMPDAEVSPAAPEAAPEFEEGDRVVLLLPGSWVWSGLEVIPRAARRQSAAVGYMLEDQLAEDVEDLHFVCHPVEGDLCSVFAVSRRKMDALHSQLSRLGWPVIAAIPEFGLLNAAASASAVWLDGARAHIWQAPGRGLTINRALLLPVAESLMAPAVEGDAEDITAGSATESTQAVGIHLFGAAEELEMGGLSQLGVVATHPEKAEDELLASYAPGAAGNLLTGEYQIVLGTQEGPWWRKPAIALAACFVLQLVFFVGAGTYFKIQANQADSQARAIFSEVFPGDTPRADLRRQIAGYLNQASGGNGDFARQLQQLAGVWNTGKPGDLRLQSLRFDGNRGELVLQVRAANLGQLDEIVGKLSNSQYQAELLAANELESGVSGRIRLR